MLLWIALAAAEPTFSVERGLFDAPLTLEIQGDQVLWGLGPGAPDTPYTGPIEIDRNTTVRAIEAGDERPTTHTYLFLDELIAPLDPRFSDDPRLERTLWELPIVALTVGAELLQTELPASAEFFHENVQIDCGARDVGGHSLNYEKNNIRLNFRTAYGQGTLRADLFSEFPTGLWPADEHDALNLRGGSHDSVFYLAERGQYLRGRFMDETHLELGHVAPHGRWVHLVLDLEYIGLYEVRERFDAGLVASYWGGDEHDYEAVNGNRVVDGSGVSWAQVQAAASDFESFRDVADAQNFVDYMLINFYAANAWDWSPTHNWMAAGPPWVFHSSDNDICMWYPPETNILALAGPSWLFQTLHAESHPDFGLLLQDRIHALFQGDGVLTPDRAGARYQGLSQRIDDAVVAEAARWGGGWWDPDVHWVDERAYLLEQWFPVRTALLLDQMRTAGWMPLEPPIFSREGGVVQVGDELVVRAPAGTQVVVTLDGTDPTVAGTPVAQETVVLDASRTVKARTRQGTTWGPLHQGFFEVDQAPAVVLNEWNAVAPDQDLDAGDAALGALPGNGGDWLELLVLQDVDTTGWTLRMQDRRGALQTVALPALDLPAGTLVTVAEDLPQDLAYDPASGDWRLHVTAPLDVTHLDWQLTIVGDQGQVIFGPVGEGVAPLHGLGSDEVGWLAVVPDADFRRDSDGYRAGRGSTYGAANPGQDLSALRGPGPQVTAPVPAGCAVVPGGGLLLALFALACVRREDSGQDLHYEVCNGVDDDGDGLIDDDDPDLADPLPLYEDADGDGVGDQIAWACGVGPGIVATGGDCDDADASVHPGAVELCDDVDSDCDGLLQGCAAPDCEGLSDGVHTLALPSGAHFEGVCQDGWTLAFVRNSAARTNQPDFGVGDVALDGLAVHPADASASAEPLMSWFDLNTFDYDQLRLDAWANGALSAASEPIERSSLRIDFGEPGYLLYGDPYVWCGGPASYTDAGVGAVNNPEGAPADCRGHGSLGSGWDFSLSHAANQGLTLCGADGSAVMLASWGSGWVAYGNPGVAYAIWVR